MTLRSAGWPSLCVGVPHSNRYTRAETVAGPEERASMLVSRLLREDPKESDGHAASVAHSAVSF
jgi:hypothetical protein